MALILLTRTQGAICITYLESLGPRHARDDLVYGNASHYISRIFDPLHLLYVCDIFSPHGNTDVAFRSDNFGESQKQPQGSWESRKGCSQDHGKGGLSLRGVAFMTASAVLTVLAVLESTLPSFCLSYKIQHNEATLAGLDGFGGFGGHGLEPPKGHPSKGHRREGQFW